METFLSLPNLLMDSFLRLSLSFLLIGCSFASQKPHCNAAEQSCLLQLKHSFVFDGFGCDPLTSYNKLSSWKIENSCCSWDGVHCDNQTGHVIGLNLWNSCLFGSISSSSPLFRLAHLKTLNLSLNNFNLSRIPEGISSLSRLTHLDLSFSNFTGQIPSGILHLSNLVSLDLSGYSLTLQDPGLKDIVEAFPHLALLRLIGVNISSTVPHSMSNLTSLSSLDLGYCSLSGEFPSNIFQLPNLRILYLWNNANLSGYLPGFHVGSPLQQLRIDYTNFSGQIPVSIGNLKSLRRFGASGSHLGGKIPFSIGNLTKLEALDLSDNYFSGDIPSSIGNLFRLKRLMLSHNNFSSSTLHWVCKLSNIELLSLSSTNLYGLIPSLLQNLTQLSGLWLSGNQLTGEIPSWFGNFTQLNYLYISTNQLQGSVPSSIFELPNIQSIGFRYNNLSGSLRFDTFLQSKHLAVLELSESHLSLVRTSYANASLPKFKFLGLAGCNLSEFPSFLHGQHELQALYLFDNNIRGDVPGWIFDLKSLSILDLGQNYLTGFEHSPRVGETLLFCGFTSLLILDMPNNNLGGNLPPCLANLASSALYLNLRNNSLSGEIPDSFQSDCALKAMDLSQNRIEGEVPRSLSNCSMLEILNLNENQMNGVFPSWLGILPRLRVLSLRSNKFHGELGQPSSKLEFNQLQIMDLSDNNFTGKLPSEYFENWVAMGSVGHDHLAYMEASTKIYIHDFMYTFQNPYFIKLVNKGIGTSYEQILEFFVVVDLSSNMFEGEIPDTIGTLRALKSLNLSNNVLTGQIPPSLGNLQDLEALDLSVNQLTGFMPVQLSLLTFLSIFNVSHNNLIGPVPRVKQFGTFPNDSFSANPGLCGPPLSETCEEKSEIETSPLPPLIDEVEVGDSFYKFGWEVVLLGCGCGFVIGAAFGCAMDTSKYERRNKKYARRQLYVHF